MRILTDIQLRLLKEEFPATSHSGDEDIERYFELRKTGRQAKALALYRGRISRKYPDPARRELLLRYYRSRDPRYGELYRDSLAELAERLIKRTYGIIDTLTRDIDSVDMGDAYSVIKLAEGLLSVISPDRGVAISFTERYARYAALLGYRERQARDAAELIRLYVTETIESVEELKREREERRKERARVRTSPAAARPGFDLSRVEFSPEEVNRITIPESVTRTEDKVIAYCAKYWASVGNPAFEKAVFLYSKKYRTRHSDIFQAVKNGVTHGWKDEEILNAVLANVVTGYYYSISGDRYLQTAWARYRAASGHAVNPAAAEAMPAVTSRATPAPVQPIPTRARKSTVRSRTRATASKRAKSRLAPRPEKAVPTAKRSAPNTFRPEPPRGPFTPNSVSDMIRKLTGKSYAVYKDLFFRDIRPSIRTTLAEAGGKDKPFGSRQNSAEQIIYDYLYAHWNDPYQRWEHSEAREKTRSLGYRMDGLEPIIARWIKDAS